MHLRNRKTSRVRLLCDDARGECWENTREACKTRGVADILKYLLVEKRVCITDTSSEMFSIS